VKAKLLKLAARFDGLSRRERAIVAAAVVIGILMLGSTAFIEPALKKEKLFAQQLTQQQAELASLRTQIEVLRIQMQDPDKALRASLEEAKQKAAAVAAELQKAEGTLVPPQRMATLLQEFLTRNHGLKLLDLHTLAPQAVIERKPAEAAAKSGGDKPVAAAAQPNLYRHGVEIRVEGSYADLTAYLAELEHLPQRMLWDRVAVDGEHYPKIVMTVMVYTLSLDKSWLVV
jgi:MSHA biogenesis protein MshJ